MSIIYTAPNSLAYVMKVTRGYKVFRDCGVAAVCVATFGSEGAEWRDRAIKECDRRSMLTPNPHLMKPNP